MKSLLLIAVIISIVGCSVQEAEKEKPLLTKERISLKNLVNEKKDTPDSTLLALHAQHHPHGVLESRSIPGPFTAPEMNSYSDHVRSIEDLVVINPGPGEFVHVMEGQRHGYLNLVVGITETFPGGAPPLHTHQGEESHVLIEGDIVYAFGDTIFTIKAPYIINIPPMVPHAFKNIGKETANLVVIFPTNVWQYDVLDYFPFESDTLASRFEKFKSKLAKK